MYFGILIVFKVSIVFGNLSVFDVNSATRKNPQMSIKVAQNRLTKKFNVLTPLQKLPKNVGDLGKLIIAKGFEKLTKL